MRKNIGNVKRLAALQHTLFALQVLQKGVLKMATHHAGTIYLVGNISAMNALTIVTAAIKMDMKNMLPGKEFGPAMAKLNLASRHSCLINWSLSGYNVQSPIVQNGAN